jgi:hypothetical protein
MTMSKDTTNPETRIAPFQRKEVRRVIHNNEWWFVITDVITALTDSVAPQGYLRDMRRRDPELAKGWGKIATPSSEALKGGGQSVPSLGLHFDLPGGPQTMLCANKADIAEYK